MPDSWQGVRFLVTTACVVIIIAGLKVAEGVLVPFMFAAFLAALTAPIVLWLQDRRVPLAISIPLVVIGVIVGLIAVSGVLVSSVNSLVLNWPKYQVRFEDLLDENMRWLRDRGVPVHWKTLHDVVRPEDIVGLVGGMVSSLGRLLTDTMLVVLTMLFLLLEVAGLPAKLRLAMGDPDADLSRFKKITGEVKDYIIIKTYLSIAVGVTVWAVLAILEVDFALLWGVVAFFFNYVPNVGAIIAGVPPVALAAVQHDLGVAAVVAAAFIAIHTVIGNLAEPHLLGRRLHLSALVVFLSLAFWGWMWGGAGMLLSVPLTMLIKIALENSDEWRWAAVLMDPAPPPPAKSRFSLPPSFGPLTRRSQRPPASARRSEAPTPPAEPAEPDQPDR